MPLEGVSRERLIEGHVCRLPEAAVPWASRQGNSGLPAGSVNAEESRRRLWPLCDVRDYKGRCRLPKYRLEFKSARKQAEF